MGLMGLLYEQQLGVGESRGGLILGPNFKDKVLCRYL